MTQIKRKEHYDADADDASAMGDDDFDFELDLGTTEANQQMESLSTSISVQPSPAPDDVLLCGDGLINVAAADEPDEPVPEQHPHANPSSSSTAAPVEFAVADDEPVEHLASRSSSSSSRPFRPLRDAGGFSVVLQDRQFLLETGACVIMKPGISEVTSGNFATVYQNQHSNQILGTLGTAAALGQSRGIKAMCHVHSNGRSSRCQCWISFKKTDHVTDDARLNLISSLSEWLAEGANQTEDAHAESSFNLRIAAGMNPRRARPK